MPAYRLSMILEMGLLLDWELSWLNLPDDVDLPIPDCFLLQHGQNVLRTARWYAGMRAPYTKGLKSELQAESQTPEIHKMGYAKRYAMSLMF